MTLKFHRRPLEDLEGSKSLAETTDTAFNATMRQTLGVMLAAAIGVGLCRCGSTNNNVPSGKVRIFHGYATDAGPGPTVDVYPSVPVEFTSNTQPAGTKPLIAGLAYGQMSDYVTVFSRPNQPGQLSYYNTGKSDDADCIWGCTPPSGFKAGDQGTIFIEQTVDISGTASVSFGTVKEHGSMELPAPSAGDGLVVGVSLLEALGFPTTGWLAGGNGPSCLTNVGGINGGEGFNFAPPSAALTFHNANLGGCTAADQVAGPTSIPVTAGGWTYAIAYGYAPSTLSIASAPIP